MERTFYHSKIDKQQIGRTIRRAKGLPVIGQTIDIISDPLQLLLELKRTGEELVKIRLGFKDYILVQSPGAARHILQENAKNYYKPGAARLMKKILGDGLATSNGELWLKQRRLMQPAFHKQKLDDFLLIIQKETNELINKWKTCREWREVDVSKDFLNLALNNITKAMFGADVEPKMDEIAEVLKIMQDFSSEATKTLFKIPLGIPTRKNIDFKQAEARFEKIIYEIINKRKLASGKTGIDERNDLLQLLIFAYDDESKTSMTEKQLKDEITTIFMAGHETTSQTLGWIFYHLASSPGFYEAVKKEKAECGEIKSFDELQKLQYTKAIIEETLRFYPPVWIIARKCFASDIIAGYKLPAGATVLINVYGLHHREKNWKDAGQFNPLNFSKEAKDPMLPFSYLPFGGGQRLCIGHHFAMMVMQTVVTKLVENFEFRVPPEFVPVIDPNLTLRAKDGIKLLVKPIN